MDNRRPAESIKPGPNVKLDVTAPMLQQSSRKALEASKISETLIYRQRHRRNSSPDPLSVLAELIQSTMAHKVNINL